MASRGGDGSSVRARRLACVLLLAVAHACASKDPLVLDLEPFGAMTSDERSEVVPRVLRLSLRGPLADLTRLEREHPLRRLGILVMRHRSDVLGMSLAETHPPAEWTPARMDWTFVHFGPAMMQGLVDQAQGAFVEAFERDGRYELVPVQRVQQAPSFAERSRVSPVPSSAEAAADRSWSTFAQGSLDLPGAFDADGLLVDDGWLTTLAGETSCDAFLVIDLRTTWTEGQPGELDGRPGLPIDVLLQPLVRVVIPGLAKADGGTLLRRLLTDVVDATGLVPQTLPMADLSPRAPLSFTVFRPALESFASAEGFARFGDDRYWGPIRRRIDLVADFAGRGLDRMLGREARPPDADAGQKPAPR